MPRGISMAENVMRVGPAAVAKYQRQAASDEMMQHRTEFAAQVAARWRGTDRRKQIGIRVAERHRGQSRPWRSEYRDVESGSMPTRLAGAVTGVVESDRAFPLLMPSINV